MVSLASLIPTDPEPYFKLAPSATTRRIYDRNLYDDETAVTLAPVVKYTGMPVRVTADEATIYPKGFNALLLDSTGLNPTTAGIWYADVIVSDDPDLSGETVVTLTHPAWPAPETRAVPAGTGAINWTSLPLVEPEDSSFSPVFLTGLQGPAGLTWRGTYSQATTYTKGDVVMQRSYVFVCTRDTALNVDPFQYWGNGWDVVVQGQSWRGPFRTDSNSYYDYNNGDIVQYQGSAYVAIAYSAWQAAFDPSHWQMLAQGVSVGASNPALVSPGLWIQTNINGVPGAMTFWIEDGT